MRWECVIISALPVVTFFIFRDKKDLFGPKNVFSLLYLLGILIPTIYYSYTPNAANVSNAYLYDALNNDNVFFKYVVLQTVAYHFVMGGIGFSTGRIFEANERPALGSTVLSSYKTWGIVFILAGFAAFMLMMGQIGGIGYFISHLQYRTSLTRDLDAYSWILPLAQYGVLLLVVSRANKIKPITFPLIILIGAIGLMCGLGGRKALLILVIEVAIVYHYTIGKIELTKIINGKSIALLLVLLVFFLVFTNLRTEGAFDKLVADPVAFASGCFSGLTDSLVGESYVPFYVKVVLYFSTNDFWQGSSFLGLFTAFVPSGIFPDKPPVDDGAYLYSICQGRSDIIPPMPFNQLNGSSYPLETFGSMYANFGTIGLLAGMFALGVVYGMAYKKMKSTSFNVLWVIFYIQVIMTFQFSTLRIFQLLECLVLLIIVVKISESLLLTTTTRYVDSKRRHRI